MSWLDVVAGWAVGAALYLLFAGQFTADELAAAAACGLGTSLWAAAVRYVASRRYRFERGAIVAVGRALAGLLGATTRVAWALLKAAATGAGGEIRAQPFVDGQLSDPADAGRRGVAILARSLAPDSFVLRERQGESRLELHVLTRTGKGDPRWAV